MTQSSVGQVDAVQIGPGLVHLHLTVGGLGRGVMLQSVTPTEPMLQRVAHLFYTEPGFPAPMAKLVLHGESIMVGGWMVFTMLDCANCTLRNPLAQVERDISVWNHKTYLDRPQLLREDTAVRRHRAWFAQFYTEKRKKSGSKEKGEEEEEGGSKEVENVW